MTQPHRQPHRQPKGVPTGGQFAASQKTEAGLDLDVYDDPDECVSIGAHLDSVDDDGYCNHCGHSDPNPLDDRHGVSAAYPNGRCTGCGCGVDEQGRCYQADCAQFDETSPHAGYDDIDGSGADVPTGTTPVTALREGDRVRFEDGSVSEVTSLDGDHKSVSVEFDHDPTTIASYAHEETFEVLGATHDPTPSAGAGAGAGAGPGSRPEHKIIDPDHKDRSSQPSRCAPQPRPPRSVPARSPRPRSLQPPWSEPGSPPVRSAPPAWPRRCARPTRSTGPGPSRTRSRHSAATPRPPSDPRTRHRRCGARATPRPPEAPREAPPEALPGPAPRPAATAARRLARTAPVRGPSSPSATRARRRAGRRTRVPSQTVKGLLVTAIRRPPPTSRAPRPRSGDWHGDESIREDPAHPTGVRRELEGHRDV